MIKKDTKFADVNSMLKATGKTTFIKFYKELKDFSLSDNYLAEKVYKESPTAKSPNQRFKIPRAREIFRTNQQIQALEIIIQSKILPLDIIEEAKRLLKSEANLVRYNEDRIFINEFNENFNKLDYLDSFTYDDSPEKPRGKSHSSSYVYTRNKKVAMQALKKANYLCEVNSSHKVFVRKTSNVTYTEPHHLIPLSAQVDFPNINLDREQNIVSLCSHCHNLLHYGQDYESILKLLFQERIGYLKKLGIDITYEQLCSYYT